MKAKDLNKDQTFFLSQVREEALRKTLFPVGDILKSDVKKLAEKSGLIHFAEKKEVVLLKMPVSIKLLQYLF